MDRAQALSLPIRLPGKWLARANNEVARCNENCIGTARPRSWRLLREAARGRNSRRVPAGAQRDAHAAHFPAGHPARCRSRAAHLLQVRATRPRTFTQTWLLRLPGVARLRARGAGA